MKKYDEVKIKDLDCYYLGEENGLSKFLTKNVLTAEQIKKYSTDDFMIDGCEVRHSDCIRPPFDWDKSYIKNVILSNFMEDYEVEDVTLLTKEEVDELPEKIRTCDDWYWTKSPYENGSCRAWRVHSDGGVDWSVVYYTYAVRPVFYLKSENFQEINARTKSCGVEINKDNIQELWVMYECYKEEFYKSHYSDVQCDNFEDFVDNNLTLCSNCESIVNNDDIGTSTLAIQDRVCKECIEYGYGK